MEELEQQVADLVVNTPPRRSGRKRFLTETPPTPPAKCAKRKSTPTSMTQDKLKKFYMNKTSAKFARQALETIYEEPIAGKNGFPVHIGGSKIKRVINMDRDIGATTKLKKLCRRKKVKRLGVGTKLKKLSDEDFKRRLMMLEASIFPGSERRSTETEVTPTESKSTAPSPSNMPMDILDDL